MNNICYFPIVNTDAELIDVVSRAAWFLSFCKVSRIVIPIASERLHHVKWSVAFGMDNAITERFSGIREKIVLALVSSEADLESYMATADIILKWQARIVPDFISPKKIEIWERGKEVWFVDPLNTRMEGSFYIEVGLHLLEDRPALVQENKRKFDALATRLGHFKRAYVMATGPSVWRYRLYDYEKAISLVCNSVILDDELMARVKPQILVFADPIFHFGPSQYAAAFRQRLRESARIYDFTIVIPFKYYGLFVSTIPELRDRTIAVPFFQERSFNFDLSEDFEVKTTANILTLLLVPLAATFADEIGILGCDGRPLHENTYFWGHNQKTQINDKMANIREVHPAFFAIDYNDYYLEHCQTLESELCEGERIGKRFRSLGFSHIPALKSRIGLGQRALYQDTLASTAALIVDPDAKTWAGHYMAYNEKLSAQLERDGLDVAVICRKDLSPDILATRSNYMPVLTAHSWEVGNRAENGEFVDAFESEISYAVEQCIANRSEHVLLYMYCASLEHAEVLAKLAQRFPQLSVNVNLFWLSFKLTPEYAQKWKPFIDLLDENSGIGNFVATLPTVELRDHLAELTGCILPVAPHPSTGVSDQSFQELSRRDADREREQTLHVLFPSAPRPEKGYLSSIETVRLLCEAGGGFLPIIRHATTFSTPKQFAQPLTKLAGAEVIEGELTDDEFIKLFSRSDIVVLPYTPDAFAERTSGLLIDSMYLGIPCVVIRGTWLGNLTEKYGCGVVVDELSATNLVGGVMEIAADYEAFRLRARQAGRRYFTENSWSFFSKFLRRTAELEGRRINMRVTMLVGPNSREQHAHWDETNGIAELFSLDLSGSVMIDVGAHHGSALFPFLNKGWSIFAFEPDENNRSKLLERLSKHKSKHLVSLDTRCVSNESQKGVSFFTSEQSTGISGLSAFHETHHETQTVDITTLTEFFQDKIMPAVDFLKIDTEGHDLFVLQGYPWERGKPVVIECEFEDTKTVPLGYTFHDLAKFLDDKGYTVYVSEWHPIIRYGIRHDWHALMRYPCELADPKGWGNLLAFRDPIDDQSLVAAVKKVLKASARVAVKAAANPVYSPVSKALVPASLSGEPTFRFEPSPHFVQTAPNQWRYTFAEAKQKLWIAVMNQPVLAGQEWVGGLRIQADRSMTVNVSLGRHGSTDYEGAAQRIRLAPGVAQSVKLGNPFGKTHAALKLQVEVLELPGGGSANLKVEELFIAVSPAAVKQSLGYQPFTLREANRLLRDGELTNALQIYLDLYEQRPMQIYADNALYAARRLGLGRFDSIDKLRQSLLGH
ncbi:MAG: FkbM family methyltransferase [Cyanobium sp. PLM2.Bin73]|nr:MAG: FkbM family methyltransferase [Cyanobium sp. PLM2.Bin73]